MFTWKPLSFTTLATAIALFANTPSATASDFLKTQQSQIATRQASMTAAVEHQEIVIAELKVLQSEGHVATQDVISAINTLETLKGERALVQQMAEALLAVRSTSSGSEADLLVLPIPALKDLQNTETISHVSFKLESEDDKQLAAKIKSLLAQLRMHQATAMHDAIGERLQRLAGIEKQNAATIREQQLLSLRHTAYKAATTADLTSLPILSNSANEYSIGDKTVRGEDDLIRLIANDFNRLRYATTLNQRQHQARLWKQKVGLLQQLDVSDSRNQRELDYVRSGHDFYAALANKLEAGSDRSNVILTSSSNSSSSLPAVLSELQEVSRQNLQRQQRAIEKCMALTSLEEKLARLAGKDSFFAGELATTRRALMVARAEAAVHRHTNDVQSAVGSFVESLSPFDASTAIQSNSPSATQALYSVFELAVDNTAEMNLAKARVTVAESRAAGMKALHEEGFASWWDAKDAEARLQDLKTEVERQELIQQINVLSLKLIKDGDPILPEEQTVALSN